MRVQDIIKIIEGPFAGLNGTLVYLTGERAVITLNLPSRQIEVELDSKWIMTAPPDRRSVSNVRIAPLGSRNSA
jgi:hypothetical protein